MSTPHSSALPFLGMVLVLLLGCAGRESRGKITATAVEEPLAPTSAFHQEIFLPPEALGRTCVIHGDIRTNVVLAVDYGLPAPRPDVPGYAQAQRTLFPNCWWTIRGGCVVPDGGSRLATVSCCPRCREEEIKWEREHEKQ